MSSGASAPSLAPTVGVPASAPTLVPLKPKPGKRRFGWILGLILLAVGVERGIHYYRTQTQATGSAMMNTIRVATVRQGPVVRTLRLTGTTGAEKYSSLVTPQLRRGGGGASRDGSMRSNMGGGGGGGSIQSNARGGNSGGGGGNTSSGSSTSTGSDGSSASTPSVASTSGQASAGGSAAFRSATSRVARTPAPAASSSRSGSTTPSSSSTSSSSSGGLGSTAGSLIGGGNGGGGGGGGGGASEFMLVLQDAVKPGSRVKKGDVVAEFDRQYMMTRLDDFRASVAQMGASIRKLKADLEVTRESHRQTIENAKAALDKARLDVKTIPVLGAIDAERTKLAAEEAEARYNQLLAEVKFVEIGQASQIRNAELEFQQSQVELKRAEANADRMLIKAPIAGLAVMQNTFRGTEMAQIQPGDQLFPGMMFMQVVDLSTMIINASVNQVDVDTVRIGQKANVRFDAYPGLEVPAHVAAIGAMTRSGGQRASFVKEIPVVLKIDRMDARIIPDLSVSVDVVVETEEQATVAPVSAVFRDKSDATPYVWVQKGDTWERREVALGVIGNVHAAIRSGLKPGEVVAEETPPLTSEKQRV